MRGGTRATTLSPITVPARITLSPVRQEAVHLLFNDLRKTGWALMLAAGIPTEGWQELEEQVEALLVEGGVSPGLR